MYSNMKIADMISWKDCIYYQIIEKMLHYALQWSNKGIINLLLIFDIIENCMAK